MKDLIVYFSHNKENYVNGEIKVLETGNTKIVAEKIQEIIHGDLFEIKPLHDYPYHYYECTEIAKKELNNQGRPKIINTISHIEEYDNIYLGFPNWWGTMPMCVWTFLESYDFSDKNIYPFCTHEGSGMGNSERNIKKLCPRSNVHKGLEIRGSQVHKSDNRITQWLKKQ